MGQVSLLTLIFILCSTLSPSQSWADDYETKVSGEGRVRWEYKNNSDYLDSADDKDDFVGSRFRLNIDLKNDNGVQLFIQPQATRKWGQKLFVDSGTTATTGGGTAASGSENNASGGLTDDQFTVHQSYLKYSLCEDTDLTLGRQELAYGDHLVVGNVGWSNVGRSFDALKTHTKFGDSWVDFFWSEVVETSSNSTTDRSFAGVYTSWDFISALKAFEVYVFFDNNEAATEDEQWTYGNRIAWANDSTGAKLEYTGQSEDGFQADTTVDHSFMQGLNTGIGYFYANEDYNQLFPTAHKWMGTADFFSRRNIQGPRAFVKYAWGEGMSAVVTYHNFSRVSDKHSAYSFSGGAIGTGAEQGDHIADEVDLAFTYKKSANLIYQIGGSTIMPGDFIKNAKGVPVDDGEFLYMSVLVKL